MALLGEDATKIRHGKEEHFLWNEEIMSQILAILEDVAESRAGDVNEDSVLMDDWICPQWRSLTIVADLEETIGERIPKRTPRQL